MRNDIHTFYTSLNTELHDISHYACGLEQAGEPEAGEGVGRQRILPWHTSPHPALLFDFRTRSQFRSHCVFFGNAGYEGL